MRADGRLPTPAAVERYLQTQLCERWARADRVVLQAAHAAEGDLERVQAIDRFADAMVLVESWRLSGRRLGRALVETNAAVGTPHCEEYARRVKHEGAPGQVAVVQGLVAFGVGLDAELGAALSGYTFAVAIVSAALRLGCLGHIDAQRLLTRQRTLIAELAGAPAAPLESASSWVPGAEIAAMRHEARRERLFST
jgi:urease accessory protein